MTGLIFGTIVAAWVVVLVPMWLRRHDERNESRSVERFSSAMRVLSRRGPSQSPGHRYVVLPAREQVAEVHVSGAPGPRRFSWDTLAARRPRLAERPRPPMPAPAPSAARPAAPAEARQPVRPAVRPGTRPSPRPASGRPPVRRGQAGPARRPSLAVRRRRNLLGLAVAFLLSLLLLLPGWLPGAVPLLLGLLLVAYVVHLRLQARARAQMQRSRQAVDRRTAARARRLSSVSGLLAARRSGSRSDDAAVEDAAEGSEPEEAGLDELLDDGWDPRSVPLPTYVTKPPAPTRGRTRDVAAFWNEARRSDAAPATPAPAAPAAPAAPPVPAAAADDELDAILEHRRAVGD
ncbi:hypothetical protein [Motilibacter aurantiacus]|uniref:hypothetical protein n=1 Tax=Motilibacter aurantiacus TaxID=2714955 RepID=UPI00140C57F2|nr:hypothetical protein [Motilibacter aurantiacus]NHC45937.1 hypothetical protein [Motilibacter aurantiacus]